MVATQAEAGQGNVTSIEDPPSTPRAECRDPHTASPPLGTVLLAVDGQEAVGAVGVKLLGPHPAEIRRLWAESSAQTSWRWPGRPRRPDANLGRVRSVGPPRAGAQHPGRYSTLTCGCFLRRRSAGRPPRRKRGRMFNRVDEVLGYIRDNGVQFFDDIRYDTTPHSSYYYIDSVEATWNTGKEGPVLSVVLNTHGV
jgi:hypothetical protein